MQRHLSVVGEDDSLAVAQQLMRWSESRHLPVVRPPENRVVGVISERDLLRAHATQKVASDRTVRDFMTAPAELIDAEAPLEAAALRMSEKRLGCLPVLDSGALVGLLTTSDVLNAFASGSAPQLEPRTAGLPPVSAIMHAAPIAVPGHATLLATAARMAERGVRHACVIDAEDRVIGIVSDRDVRRVLGHPKRALVPNYVPAHLHRLRVRDVMSVPRTVRQEDTIEHALSLLLSGEFSALPVTDDQGRLRGVVSYVDLLRHLRQLLAQAGGAGTSVA
ncbi:MAG TPA: CBS domain-containing protein [Polyangiales bacterium]|nr:CBS domain-containing protein [Polyangiales bacterium]